jgi:isopentenyl phosphate kinase
MNMGCVPSTGGDIVSDKSVRFSIVSGDQLAVYMARSLRAEMLVFATDVDGVFDSNPKLTPTARLIKNLSPSRVRKVGVDMSTSVTDVTGGMRGKLEEAAKAASNGIPVFFVNLLKGNRLRDLVLGKQVVCSRVLPG